jgi:hypothetical protein
MDMVNLTFFAAGFMTALMPSMLVLAVLLARTAHNDSRNPE